MQFPTFSCDLMMDPANETMICVQGPGYIDELTESVGASCPAAKVLGVEGEGEGIVWKIYGESGSQHHSLRAL